MQENVERNREHDTGEKPLQYRPLFGEHRSEF
jgi:hypothetical protein